MWPTAQASNANQRAMNDRSEFSTTLPDASRMWGTPVARDDQKSPEARQAMLERLGGGRTEITSLTVQSKMWGTPRASDAAKGTDPPHGNGGQTGLKQQLHSHLHATTTTDGPTGSPRADLNPFFVATLMGLPMDWLTHSTSAVTASCLKQLQKPSGNSAHVPDGY